MKFKLYATLAVWAFLAVSVLTGGLPIGAALILFVIASAALTPYRAGIYAACPDYFSALRVATEHLGDEIHQSPSPATPFYNFITRGVFEKHTGVTHTTFVAGRVEPTSKSAGWSAVSLANNIVTGAGCSDSFTEIGVGFDEATFAPRKLQLQGPPICRDQLTYAHRPMDFIQNHYVPSLTNYVKRKIDLEFRDQSMQLGNKISIVGGAFNQIFTGTTNPTVAPYSQLTWDFLDQIAIRKIRDGASTNTNGGVIELGPDGPVFPIFIGLEMLQQLATNVSAIRDDFRNADMGKGSMANTLRAIGASRQIKNWRFAAVTHPPRADFVGGILVEREAFEDVAATRGTKSTETAAYRNAEFEAAIMPDVRQYSANVVSPDNAGLDFDSGSWNGEWKFVTGGERIAANNVCYDPLHKWGRHYSEYAYAAEPIHTNYGWTAWFSRCANSQARTSCTATYNP